MERRMDKIDSGHLKQTEKKFPTEDRQPHWQDNGHIPLIHKYFWENQPHTLRYTYCSNINETYYKDATDEQEASAL